MSQIKHTVQGRVVGVYLGLDPDVILSTPQDAVKVTFTGLEGDYHAGVTRITTGGSKYPRGTELRNDRQVTLVSVEELAEVAADMGIPEIRAEWICANVLVEGIPSLTLLPPSTRLYFPGGVTLVVEGQNPPCAGAGGSIQERYPDVPGLTSAFPKTAIHRRGLIATVEHPGVITSGDDVRAEVPEYTPYDVAP